MEKNNIQIESSLPADIFLEKDNRYLKRVNEPPTDSSPSYYSFNDEDEEDRLDLRKISRILWKRRWMIFAIVSIVTTLTAIQAFRIKPWYSSSTVMEIGKQNSMVLTSGEMKLNDDGDADPFYIVTVNTRKLALESPELFAEVVNELELTKNEKVLEDINKSGFFSFLSAKERGVKPPDNSNIGELEETLKLKPFVEYLKDNTSVEPIKNTRALKISFTNEDPVLAATVSKSIADVFTRRTFSSQTERFRNSADWLDRSTRELKAKVQESEENLAGYTRANQIYATDGGEEGATQTLTTSKLTQLHDKYIRTRTERMLKESLYQQVNSGRIDELPEVFSDPKIIEIQKALNQAQAQAAELKAKFGPTNPKMVEVNNQISVLSDQIQKSRSALENKFRAEYERAVRDERALEAELNTAKSQAATENQASIRYNILKQDVDTARDLYKNFLLRTNQANAQVAEQNNSIKLLQGAQIPTKPDGPKRMMIILLGFSLSLGGSVGLAYLLESLDETVKTVEDVERYAKLPVLGIIPLSESSAKGFFKRKREQPQIDVQEDGSHLGLVKENMVLATMPKAFEDSSISSEAYLSLRTSLLLSSAEHPPKTMLFTSGAPGEGKTTTAVNTAVSLTKLGSKVLIIDCDLRRPTIHRQLGISSAKGVTNYLSSSEFKLEDLIQELSIPNLFAMTSGPIPPNPTELLSSQKMREMLEKLYDDFDHIIIDAPPVISVVDPIILSTIVEGTVFVINSGKTTRYILQRSTQKLSAVNSKVLGAVLNNVDLHKDGYSYYHYNYYQSNENKNA